MEGVYSANEQSMAAQKRIESQLKVSEERNNSLMKTEMIQRHELQEKLLKLEDLERTVRLYTDKI